MHEELAIGEKVGRGLATLAAGASGISLLCWSVGMGELLSRRYPPLRRSFELDPEEGHSVKGLQHPERTIFYVNRRQQGNRTSYH